MLLSKVFDHFRVPLGDKYCESMEKDFNLNNVKHMKLNHEIEHPASHVVSADVPEPKRKRTEETFTEMMHEFNVSHNVPQLSLTLPIVTHAFDLNKTLNFEGFFPNFSPTRNAANILEGMSS